MAAALDPALNPEWIDSMVTRLKAVLEKQLKSVEEAQGEDSAQSRAADARTLATLERTLEKLSLLERERAAVKEKKIAHDGQGRAALERRLDKRLAALAKTSAAGKPG